MKNTIAAAIITLGALCAQTPVVSLDFEKGLDGSFTVLNPAWVSVTQGGALSGKSSLRLDTRASKEIWNPAFATRSGALKPATDYTLTFRCQILELGEDSMIHTLIRPATGDASRDAGSVNLMDTNGVQRVKYSFRTKKDIADYAFQIHPKKKALALIDDVVIVEGRGDLILAAKPDAKPFAGKLAVATGCPDFTVAMPAPAAQEVSVARFGAKTSLVDNAPAFREAIAHCLSNKNGRLVVPKGVYRFTNELPIAFRGFTDFTFDGQGSEFIFLKPRGTLMEVASGDRVCLKNFLIDWDWEVDPLATVIRVKTVESNGAHADFEMPDYKEFPRKDMRIADIEGLDPATLSVGFEGAVNRGFEFSKGRNPPAKYEWLTGNVFRMPAVDKWLRDFFLEQLKPGDLFRMRHYVYDMVGLDMRDNTNLTLSNVTVYSAPSHAFVTSGDQHHWQLLNTHIIRRPGTKRPITCTADHLHIGRSMGYFRMIGCEFSLGGDDCLNVHDTTGFAYRGPQEALLTKNTGTGGFRPGDPIELRHDDYSPTGWVSRLKAVRGSGSKAATNELEFEDPLPPQTTSGFVLFNRRYGSKNVLVKNCTFHDNRARGLLLLTDHVTVESNRFFHNQMGAIKIETGYTFNVWSEGYGASNIVIRNNLFDQVNPIGAYTREMQPVIYMSAYLKSDPSEKKTRFPILNTILVESNTFRNHPGAIAYVCSAGNVVIRDNRIENPLSRKENLPFRGAIGVSWASNVSAVNNTWVASPWVLKPGLHADPETTGNLLFEGNRVVEGKK